MEENLVSFETATLLKEKGFNISTLYYYREIDGGLDYPDETIGDLWNIRKGCVSAPTQQLACKWLREVHKYNIKVDFFFDGKECRWYYIINPIKKSAVDLFDGIYLTYEGAIEAGLIYALKELI